MLKFTGLVITFMQILQVHQLDKSFKHNVGHYSENNRWNSMNQLKYLGKPAPYWDNVKCQCSKCYSEEISCDCRADHLEGAIKEAWELLKIHSSSWPHDVWAYAEQWDAETYGGLVPWKEERVKDFVAFLLRKTIGNKE